jgi:hypothetical protein
MIGQQQEECSETKTWLEIFPFQRRFPEKGRIMKISTRLYSIGFIIALQCTAIAKERATYDLGTDFSLEHNPNGVWTYGMVTAAGDIVPFAVATTTPDDFGKPVEVWLDPLTSDAIFHNNLTETVISNGGDGVHPPNSVWSHPPLTARYESMVVRFTAPAPGRYQISASFRKVLSLVGNDVDLRIRHNGTELFSDTLERLGEPSTFHTKLKLRSGDTIEFLLADPGDGTYGDAVFMDITITPKKHSQVGK